jgi:hypothetical protein
MRSRIGLLLVVFAIATEACEKSPPAESRTKPTVDSVSDRAALEAAAKPMTPQQIAKGVFPSVALLIMNDGNGQPHALGSGFFVRPGLIATNYHVIEGAGGGTAKLNGQDAKYTLGEVAAEDPAHDLALVTIVGVTGPPLRLSEDALEVGQPIFAIGNPRGLEGTFSSGIVSSLRALRADTIVQITAPISPGSSGGPVIDDRGAAVGVATASFSAGQNLNFAVPVKYLRALLSAGATPHSFESKRAASNNSFLRNIGGRKSAEGVVGSGFAWDRDIRYDLIIDAVHGGFTLSLRNQLGEDVRNVSAAVIFYDSDGQPVEVSLVGVDYVPAGLARRVAGKVDASVQRLTTHDGAVRPYTKLGIRVLGFDLSQE